MYANTQYTPKDYYANNQPVLSEYKVFEDVHSPVIRSSPNQEPILQAYNDKKREVSKRDITLNEKPRTPAPSSPRQTITKRSITPESRSVKTSRCPSPKSYVESERPKVQQSFSIHRDRLPIRKEIAKESSQAEVWDIKFANPEISKEVKQLEIAERLQRRHINKSKSKKVSKTKEELLQIRKDLLKSKIVKKQVSESVSIVNQKDSPQKVPNPELLKRLSSGEKSKVTREEMKRLTAKHYKDLPEVKKKQEIESKKQEMLLRIEKAKVYNKNRLANRKIKDN